MRRPWLPKFEILGGKRVCKIPLSQGMFAMIDAKWLSEAQTYSWYVRRHWNTYYVLTNLSRLPNGGRRLLSLHQLIWQLLGRKAGPIDHKSGDGLDNRRNNLRPGPPKLNNANNTKRASATSKYKGVSWNLALAKWHAQIQIEGSKQHLGFFSDEEQAARAYDRAARKAWGSYAKLNFPSSYSKLNFLSTRD